MSWWSRAARWGRVYRLDIIWVVFVGINLAAMRLLPAWQTVPFLAIWVSLTAIYGLRLWRLQPTILTWAAVTLATPRRTFGNSPRRNGLTATSMVPSRERQISKV